MSKNEKDTEDRKIIISSLTEYISVDLKNRILSEDLGPKDLSLLALADHYKVSVTPMRAAIEKLVADGVFVRLPNRRIQISPFAAKQAETRQVLATPPNPQDWDEILIKEVVHASMSLDHTYLREDTLSKKIGVGRSIVRQVLHRFAGAGLIEHKPRRGWLVHPLGVEDMRAFLVVREALELKALKLAGPRLDREKLERIRTVCKNGAKGNLEDFDNSIHEYIIKASGNRYIQQFFRQYVARYYAELFFFAAPQTTEVEEMSNEHIGIIDALLERRWSQAEKLLSAHILGQATILVKLLEK